MAVISKFLLEGQEWTELTVHPVRCSHDDGRQKAYERCREGEAADMWTVYAKLADGREMAIADFEDRGKADELAYSIKMLVASYQPWKLARRTVEKIREALKANRQ